MSLNYETKQGRSFAKSRRIWALVRKEAKQMIRDPSSIALGDGFAVGADRVVRVWVVAGCQECSAGGGAGGAVAGRAGFGGGVCPVVLLQRQLHHRHVGGPADADRAESGRHRAFAFGFCAASEPGRRPGGSDGSRHRRQPRADRGVLRARRGRRMGAAAEEPQGAWRAKAATCLRSICRPECGSTKPSTAIIFWFPGWWF